MSAIISGLIGGAVAIVLTNYIARRVGNAGTPGQLRFGGFMWGLGLCCLVMATLPVAATVVYGHDKDFWAKAALVAGFGLGALYSFAEAGFVRGRFDEAGIEFSTPWTGRKAERWADLKSVKFVDSASWYTLAFKSGAKIRLSRYLGGHASALEAAERTTGIAPP